MYVDAQKGFSHPNQAVEETHFSTKSSKHLDIGLHRKVHNPSEKTNSIPIRGSSLLLARGHNSITRNPHNNLDQDVASDYCNCNCTAMLFGTIVLGIVILFQFLSLSEDNTNAILQIHLTIFIIIFAIDMALLRCKCTYRRDTISYIVDYKYGVGIISFIFFCFWLARLSNKFEHHCEDYVLSYYVTLTPYQQSLLKAMKRLVDCSELSVPYYSIVVCSGSLVLSAFHFWNACKLCPNGC